MKEIPLTKGRIAIVDDEDYDQLMKHSWYARVKQSGKAYAIRNIQVNKHAKPMPMHVQLMTPPDGMIVDHIDGNTLNNTRANLRIVTWKENCFNKRPQKTQLYSKFKGVTYHKADGYWWARITANSKTHSLGYFKTETEAAMAYDAASVEIHGEFGFKNFPAANT